VSHTAILVEGLSKRYRIRAPRSQARSGFRVPGLGFRDLWALRDVSFEVAAGEVVGILGRNGAGKSTLLKILSGVTWPTTGRARMRGRVISLLEVGTGFHPDLTGRENVYLNGALLGMTRAEIRRKFDEIVAFAEVEPFLDTPIKHYSTGMQMRLAFAVAAHLDGEIMIVDEALSVGDAAFQAKCAEAMAAARDGGRTVLLVSHNVAMLRGLAGRAILLQNGRIEADGAIQDICGRYLAANADVAEVDLRDYASREGTGEARFDAVRLLGPDGALTNRTWLGGPLHVRFRVTFHRPIAAPQFGVRVYSTAGEPLVDLQGRHAGLCIPRAAGAWEVDLHADPFNLYPGRYLLSLWVYDRSLTRLLDYVKLCASLLVEPADPTGRGIQLCPQQGMFFVSSRWEARPRPEPALCVSSEV